MHSKRRDLFVGVSSGVAATVLGLLLMALGAAYSGAYNVVATAGHAAGIRWLLDTAIQASVRSHAAEESLAAATTASDPGAGAGQYKAMCEHCHGGPGVAPADWSRGMLPRPPHLVEAASHWDSAELLWIVRHGIKSTGMPAFGETHHEQALRDIVAFVERLPAMTPEAYRSAGGGHGNAAGTQSSPRQPPRLHDLAGRESPQR